MRYRALQATDAVRWRLWDVEVSGIQPAIVTMQADVVITVPEHDEILPDWISDNVMLSVLTFNRLARINSMFYFFDCVKCLHSILRGGAVAGIVLSIYSYSSVNIGFPI